MADEVKEVVKDGVVSGSTADASTDGSVKTPVDEKSTTKATEKEVPYDRFQEVIAQKNKEKQLREQYEAKIKELEGRLPNPGQDRMVQRLVAGGMKEDAARLIADTTREEQRRALEPIMRQRKDEDVKTWTRELERSDPDYKKLKTQLAKAFDELPDEEKMSVVSSPQGLERFYKAVKADSLTEEISKARAEGVKQGYETKSLKEGLVSGTKSGTAVDEPLTFESIRAGALKKMSDEEYMKRQSEINAIVAKGPSRK